MLAKIQIRRLLVITAGGSTRTGVAAGPLRPIQPRLGNVIFLEQAADAERMNNRPDYGIL